MIQIATSGNVDAVMGLTKYWRGNTQICGLVCHQGEGDPALR